jgi:hypothetical protein
MQNTITRNQNKTKMTIQRMTSETNASLQTMQNTVTSETHVQEQKRDP